MDLSSAWFEENKGCGRCGYPLGPCRVWYFARDDFPPEVVAAARDGSINKMTCRQCGFAGWMTRPFLWVDCQVRRAVFVQSDVWRPAEVDAERDRLLALALNDVPPPERAIILRRLQEARYHLEIPNALAETGSGSGITGNDHGPRVVEITIGHSDSCSPLK